MQCNVGAAPPVLVALAENVAVLKENVIDPHVMKRVVLVALVDGMGYGFVVRVIEAPKVMNVHERMTCQKQGHSATN